MVLFLGSITIRPSLVSGISTCKGKELQMRVQFEYVVGHHKQDVRREHLKQELKELKNNSICVCCRMCGSTILPHERYVYKCYSLCFCVMCFLLFFGKYVHNLVLFIFKLIPEAQVHSIFEEHEIAKCSLECLILVSSNPCALYVSVNTRIISELL